MLTNVELSWIVTRRGMEWLECSSTPVASDVTKDTLLKLETVTFGLFSLLSNVFVVSYCSHFCRMYS